MSQETFTTADLETFKWDESGPDTDFFAEAAKTDTTDEADKTEEKKDKEEKPEEINFFGENDKATDEGGEEGAADKVGGTDDKGDDTDKTTDLPVSHKSVASFLKERGLIDFDLEEGEEIDEDEAESLIENGYETSVEKRVEGLIADLPDSVKNLVKFATNGGDVDQYIANLAKAPAEGVTSNLDMTKESNQEKFMKFKLTNEGNDEEYIEAQLDFLRDSGKLESIATKAFGTWKSKEIERTAQVVEQQKERVRQSKIDQLEYKKEIANHLTEVDNINNLKFTKQDIKDLPEYIGNNNVALADGRTTTPFYRDLFESMKDKNKLAMLAKLVKNNFDFKDIEKAAATRQAKNVKDELQRQKEGKKLNTASGSSQPKRLAEYFN